MWRNKEVKFYVNRVYSRVLSRLSTNDKISKMQGMESEGKI
jgi:hypothetical protein